MRIDLTETGQISQLYGQVFDYVNSFETIHIENDVFLFPKGMNGAANLQKYTHFGLKRNAKGIVD